MACSEKRLGALVDGRGTLVPAAIEVAGPHHLPHRHGRRLHVIHLPDSSRLGVDPSQLTGVTSLGGIGGRSEYAHEPAGLVFLDADQKTVLEAVPSLLIGLPNRSPNVVSLLGRDVLSRFRLVVDMRSNVVELQ